MKSPFDLGLTFPAWRSGQQLAIRECLHAKTPHVVICAPTGAGKSLIAAALPRLDARRRYVTLTATKGLQQQYENAYPFLYDLKGASNYPCLAAVDELSEWFPVQRRSKVTCDDGPCHAGIKCQLKDEGCRYFDRRRQFLIEHAGLTNYAAWLSNRRVGQGLGIADTLTCDEAHALPEQLMSAFRLDIPRHLLDTNRAPRTVAGWKAWASAQLEALSHQGDDSRVRIEKTNRNLMQLVQMDKAWAWDEDDEGFHFEPTIPRLLFPLLQSMNESSRVIYLSATITPATLDLFEIPRRDVTFVRMKSTFDVARRPVYILPGARVDFRSLQKEETLPRLVSAMDNFMEDRNDRKGLIQPPSFDLGWRIFSASRNKSRLLMHHRGVPAGQVVEAFKRDSRPNVVLVSPSIKTGFDFKYAEAEFNLIPKLPFPDTRSTIMRARIKNTDRYRDHVTMQSLVQACGRPVRAEDDQAETAIFDEHFGWWYRQAQDLSPPWFDDAVIKTRKRVRPLPKL